MSQRMKQQERDRGREWEEREVAWRSLRELVRNCEERDRNARWREGASGEGRPSPQREGGTLRGGLGRDGCAQGPRRAPGDPGV